MGAKHARLAVLVAALLITVPIAGCLGSSSQSQSENPAEETDDTDTGEETDSSDTDSDDGSSDQEEEEDSDDGSQDDTGDDGESTDEPTTQTETFDNSTSVPASAANPGMGNTPEMIIPGNQGEMWLIEERPANLTGVLVEFTWSATTKDLPSGYGKLQADIDDGEDDDEWVNESVSEDGELRIKVKPKEWEEGHLWTWVHPRRGGGLWIDAEVTAYATVFTGGPPDWTYSAI